MVFLLSLRRKDHADSNTTLVIRSNLQGQRTALSIGAKSYHECSALLNEGVDDVFEKATRVAMVQRADGAGGGEKGHHQREGRGKKREEGGEGGGCGCVVV